MSAEDDALLASRVDALYAFAILCDEKYGAALRKLYGKNAGDMRYQPDKQPEDVRSLGTKKVEAFEAWRQAYSSKINSERESTKP